MLTFFLLLILKLTWKIQTSKLCWYDVTLSKCVVSHNPFFQLNVKLRDWPWLDSQRASVKSMNDCFSFPLSRSSQNILYVSLCALKETLLSESVNKRSLEYYLWEALWKPGGSIWPFFTPPSKKRCLCI